MVEATEGRPEPGTSIPLDAVNSLGRDVNNSIVLDDSFVSADHALLTFRGRAWYVEDRGSTNGTWLNGQKVGGLLPLGYGDEVQIGQVRLRLERERGSEAHRERASVIAMRRALLQRRHPAAPPLARARPARVVALTLVVGWASLQSFRSGQLEMGEASLLFTYLLAVFVIHAAFVITGRRMDQILLPDGGDARRASRCC